MTEILKTKQTGIYMHVKFSDNPNHTAQLVPLQANFCSLKVKQVNGNLPNHVHTV